MSIEKLTNLLLALKGKSKSDFLGLGLIIYNNIYTLPVTPLIKSEELVKLPIFEYNEIIETLAEISREIHPLHDGFHMISSNLTLTHVSVYFSTPIVKEAKIKFDYGSRYRTALYGSYLKEVYACCIMSKHYEPLIFMQGCTYEVSNKRTKANY